MMPLDLDATLSEVASRRCAECHQAGVPRKFYTRVMNPRRTASCWPRWPRPPAAREKCGQPVFASTADPDYQKILRTFDPIHALLKERPREDLKACVSTAMPTLAAPVSQ